MPLPVRGETRRHEHLAARLHAHVGALVRADPRPLDVARHAQPEIAPLRARGRLARAKVGEADHAERHLEAGRVVAAVVAGGAAVLERQAHVPRKLVGLDQVAPSHLHRIEPELAPDQPDDALHHEGAVRASGAPVWRDLHLVGVDDVELAPRSSGCDTVPGSWAAVIRGTMMPYGRVGAGVVNEPVAEPEDAPRLVDRDLDLVALTALLARADEVLPPILGPLHRPAELHGGVRHQDLLRIEEHDLGAERRPRRRER